MTLQELREKRAKIVADMQSVIESAEAEGRVELNEEEAELYASYEQDLESTKNAISRKENLESEAHSLEQPEPAKTSSQGADRPMPGPEAKREFESVGDFMAAVTKHYNGKGDDPRLTWDDSAGIQAADQQMSDGASGGFLVPTQFRDTLLKVDPQEALIESRSNVMEVGTPPDSAITMPALDQTGSSPDNVYGGIAVDWIGEGDTKPETDAVFREIELQPHEIAAHVPITDKLMRNAPAMSGQIETLMRGALAGARERAYLQGDGVAKPLGMINAGAAYAVNRGTASEVNYTDLDSMVGRLHMDGSPYWLISQSAYSQLTRVQDPNGNYVWQPNAVEGSPGSLFGYPVFFHQRSPVLGNKGDVVLCSTNPYYMVKPGSGPFVAMGYINNDFVQNRTRVKVFHNVDGKPWLTEPFTQEGGYDVSPFVVLDTP